EASLLRSPSSSSNERCPELHSGHLVTSSASSIFLVGMVSLIDEDIGSDQGQGGGADRADRGKRLLDRSEHFHDLSQRPIPLVAHIGASRGGELRADEDRPIVGDVLDHAETPHAPSRPGRRNAWVLYKLNGIFL